MYNTRPEQLEDCMPGVKNITLTNSPPSVTKLIYKEILHLNFIPIYYISTAKGNLVSLLDFLATRNNMESRIVVSNEMAQFKSWKKARVTIIRVGRNRYRQIKHNNCKI